MRAIADILKAEGIVVSFATVSRIVSPPRPRRAPAAPRLPPQALPPRTPEPAPVAATTEPEPPVKVSDDPAELQREDWLFYERQKLELRRRAETEYQNDNLRGYRDLMREARAAEERAVELRPPAPPDPDKDPTMRREARALVDDLEKTVRNLELGGEVLPRTLPPLAPIAA